MAVVEQKPKHYFRDQRSRAEELADEGIKERVMRGLEALQEEHGDGWADHIDPAKLDMGSCRYCVLGQVYGDYGNAPRGLSGSHNGFDSDPDDQIFYGDLDKAWKFVIFDIEEE